MEYTKRLTKLAKKGYKPGDKINRTYCCVRFVASIGTGKDWAVYLDSLDTSWEKIATNGNKIRKEDAEKIYPEIAALGLAYRP